MIEETAKGNLYINQIKINNNEDYEIKQVLPVFKESWFTINEKEQLEQITTKDSKNGDKQKQTELFSIVPVLIKAVYENIQSLEQKIELLYYRPQTKIWNTVIIDKNILADKRNIVTLFHNGIPIHSSNASIWVKYFAKLEELNFDTIPIIKMTEKLGWYNDCSCFVPYTNEIQVDVEQKLNRWLNAYNSKGTLEQWTKEIKEFRDNNLFRFILSSSFASPLIKPLEQRIFIVFNYGKSRAGKSATLHGALSVWGNPNDLKTSFNATTVGLERLANYFNDLPLALDEKQVNKSQKNIEQIVYTLANGIGRIRGNKSGGIQQMNNWHTIILATGEETLSTSSSSTGVSTRCLELEGSPFNNNEEKAQKIYEVFSHCYGTAGKQFIKILIDKYLQNNYQELKDKFKEVKTKIKESTLNDISSYIDSVSVVTLADIIVSKEFFNEKTEDLSYAMGLEILDSLSKQKDIDVVEKCYEQICSWLLSNYRFFDIYTHSAKKENENFRFEDIQPQTYTNSKTLGLYEKGTYYVLRGVLEEFLTKNGFSYNEMVREFAKRNYILSKKDSTGKIISPTIQKKFRDVNARMFAFPLETVGFEVFEEQEIIWENQIKDIKMALSKRQLE